MPATRCRCSLHYSVPTLDKRLIKSIIQMKKLHKIVSGTLKGAVLLLLCRLFITLFMDLFQIWKTHIIMHWLFQGGAPPVRAPQQDQFLLFSHVFAKKCMCQRLVPPQWVGAPPNGKSWICHCNDFGRLLL